MKYIVIIFIIFFSILLSFLSYKLCGYLPQSNNYSNRAVFCKNPIEYVIINTCVILVVFIYFMYNKKK